MKQKCIFCNGQGVIPQDFPDPFEPKFCSHCGGTGKIEVPKLVKGSVKDSKTCCSIL